MDINEINNLLNDLAAMVEGTRGPDIRQHGIRAMRAWANATPSVRRTEMASFAEVLRRAADIADVLVENSDS